MKEIADALIKIADRLFTEMGTTTDLEMMGLLLDLYNEALTLSEAIESGSETVTVGDVEEFMDRVKSLN